MTANRPSSSAAPALERTETATSRFILIRTSDLEFAALRDEGVLSLSHAQEDRSLWTLALRDDLVVAICGEPVAGLLAGRVVGKALGGSSNADKPLMLLVDPLAVAIRPRLGWGDILLGRYKITQRREFLKLWLQCSSLVKSSSQAGEQFWSTSAVGPYEVRIASHPDELRAVAAMATRHPFGLRHGFLTFVALRYGKFVGALLANTFDPHTPRHRDEARIYGKELAFIRRHSVLVSRLYTGEAADRKFAIHEALLRTLIERAGNLVKPPLSVVSAVSYDYHPVASTLGFNIEVPRSIERAFYYWLPVSPPKALVARSRSRLQMKRAIHAFLAERRKRKYLIAHGSSDHLALAREKSAWAIRDNVINRGVWRTLAAGDVCFLSTHDAVVVAYGYVAGTDRRAIPGLERFPLWVDLERMTWDVRMPMGDHVYEQWYRSLDRAGLTRIPDAFGASLKVQGDAQSLEGKMWIEPNPYLLHGTKFDVTPGQVFVIQAWNLTDRVFPFLRALLEGQGFSVKYAGDRDGQVVFDDIWRLLNESEIVIVDFTHKRPNVYLEYGMALVLGKPIVAITQDEADIPSDTPQLKYITYRDQLNDGSLSDKLLRAIRDTMEDHQHLRGERLRTP